MAPIQDLTNHIWRGVCIGKLKILTRNDITLLPYTTVDLILSFLRLQEKEKWLLPDVWIAEDF